MDGAKRKVLARPRGEEKCLQRNAGTGFASGGESFQGRHQRTPPRTRTGAGRGDARRGGLINRIVRRAAPKVCAHASRPRFAAARSMFRAQKPPSA